MATLSSSSSSLLPSSSSLLPSSSLGSHFPTLRSLSNYPLPSSVSAQTVSGFDNRSSAFNGTYPFNNGSVSAYHLFPPRPGELKSDICSSRKTQDSILSAQDARNRAPSTHFVPQHYQGLTNQACPMAATFHPNGVASAGARRLQLDPSSGPQGRIVQPISQSQDQRLRPARQGSRQDTIRNFNRIQVSADGRVHHVSTDNVSYAEAVRRGKVVSSSLGSMGKAGTSKPLSSNAPRFMMSHRVYKKEPFRSVLSLAKGRCFRCGMADHQQRTCRNPKLCFICSSTGHTANSCPSSHSSSSSQQSALSNNLSSTSSPSSTSSFSSYSLMTPPPLLRFHEPTQKTSENPNTVILISSAKIDAKKLLIALRVCYAKGGGQDWSIEELGDYKVRVKASSTWRTFILQ